MKQNFSTYVFNELRNYLLFHLGLNFSVKQNNELFKKLSGASKDFGFEDVIEFSFWLLESNLSDKNFIKLASYLTIGETYFFRENKSFEFLENKYLPELIKERQKGDKRLRIWCAACATGEEPYSIAILLKRMISDINDWNITILATDINSNFLKKARMGIYTKWSFRRSPKWFINKYFNEVENNQFQIHDDIKQMVTFGSHNLAKDNYPSLVNNTNAVDIIFCRNVLIYFSSPIIKFVTDRLYKSLLKGGILIVAAVEVTNIISSRFRKINYDGHTIYKKGIDNKKITREKERKIIYSQRSNEQEENILKNDFKSKIINSEKKHLRIEPYLRKRKVFDEPKPDYNDALKFFEKGAFDKAEKLLHSLMKDAHINDHRIISLLAKAKANLGKLEDAVHFCNRALQLDKLNPNLYFLMASIKHEQSLDNEAIQFLNKAIYLDHDFVLAHFLLGNLRVKTGNRNLGLKHYKNVSTILSKLNPDELLPESDGITVGQFFEVVNAIEI